MAASVIQVPERDFEALEALCNLRQDEVTFLAEALRATPASISMSSYVEGVAARTSLSPSVVRAVVPLLLTMYRVRISGNWTINEFPKLLIEALVSTGRQEFQFSHDKLEEVEHSISTLLAIDNPVGIVAKASSLYYEHENLLHEFTLITDFRPVFGFNPADGVPAAMIVHTLNVVYHDRDTFNEVKVVVDEADLDRLEALIRRARSKSKSLRQMAQAASVHVLDKE
jgi:hypothetical protein